MGDSAYQRALYANPLHCLSNKPTKSIIQIPSLSIVVGLMLVPSPSLASLQTLSNILLGIPQSNILQPLLGRPQLPHRNHNLRPQPHPLVPRLQRRPIPHPPPKQPYNNQRPSFPSHKHNHQQPRPPRNRTCNPHPNRHPLRHQEPPTRRMGRRYHPRHIYITKNRHLNPHARIQRTTPSRADGA